MSCGFQIRSAKEASGIMGESKSLVRMSNISDLYNWAFTPNMKVGAYSVATVKALKGYCGKNLEILVGTKYHLVKTLSLKLQCSGRNP